MVRATFIRHRDAILTRYLTQALLKVAPGNDIIPEPARELRGYVGDGLKSFATFALGSARNPNSENIGLLVVGDSHKARTARLWHDNRLSHPSTL